jgi:hypothetical protein
MWLVTCVHIITGLKVTPPEGHLFANGRIEIVGTSASISLFDGETQRFSAVTNTTTGCLLDVMAIKLRAWEASGLLPYGSYKLSKIVAPVEGETITAAGFPGLQADLIPATSLEGKIDELEGISVKLSVPSERGFSGSALLGEAGLIGIVHGDVGEEPDLTNGLAIAFDTIASELFV